MSDGPITSSDGLITAGAIIAPFAVYAIAAGQEIGACVGGAIANSSAPCAQAQKNTFIAVAATLAASAGVLYYLHQKKTSAVPIRRRIRG